MNTVLRNAKEDSDLVSAYLPITPHLLRHCADGGWLRWVVAVDDSVDMAQVALAEQG